MKASGLSWLKVLPVVLSSLLLFSPSRVDAGVKVLIVGGGPAGIHAAATLIENGVEDYIILEPTDALRGSLKPVDFGGRTFAPGYIWGYTPIKETLDELGVAYKESDYSSYVAYNETGDDVTSEAMAREYAINHAYDYAIEAIAEDIENGLRPDLSEKSTLARGGWIASTAIDKAIEWYIFDFYEGLSTRDVSAYQSYSQGDLFPEEYIILDDRTLGYPLLGEQEATLDMSKVRFGETVKFLNQTDRQCVQVTTEEGPVYDAQFVIVTSTVGVLQNGGIDFEPPLPAWKTEEIFRFKMSTVDTIFMQFEEKFWDDTEYIVYASDREGYYPVFFNWEADGLLPAGTNILSTFLTGAEAYRAELMTDDEVKAEILEVLQNIYGDAVDEWTDFYMSRFATDENLYGNFASWPIGTVPEDAAMRLKANTGSIYFAPEDAGSEYTGIPFGSVQNGKEAAEAVAACIEDETVCEEDYTPEEPEAPPLCRDVRPYNPTKGRKVQP